MTLRQLLSGQVICTTARMHLREGIWEWDKQLKLVSAYISGGEPLPEA
jgi:predicted RNA binding protein with dsRBD fold (UPF0201 family)